MENQAMDVYIKVVEEVQKQFKNYHVSNVTERTEEGQDDDVNPSRVMQGLKELVSGAESKHKIADGLPTVDEVQAEIARYEQWIQSLISSQNLAVPAAFNT